VSDRPLVGTVGEELYGSLEPVAFADEQLGWPLLVLAGALGGMFQQAEDLARDTDSGYGWSQLVDVNRSPTYALPWLAQFVGVTLPDGLSDLDQRQRIVDQPEEQRGTVASLVAAAQPLLTGTRTVILRERDGGACPTEPAYGLTIITRASETPDPDAVEAAIRAKKPAGIVLLYETLSGQDFETVRLTYTTFDDLRATYTSFDFMRTDEP
jgi:hypothetical protein